LPLEKLKVCVHSFQGDQEAQMLAQIKILPEGDMKTALLESYIKAVKLEQKGKSVDIARKQPLFLDASYEKNTKTYIKHNREPKLQNIYVVDLAKEVSKMKMEIAALGRDLEHLQLEVDSGYPIDSWARQEIEIIKERIESLPPPLEDESFDNIVQEKTTVELQGLGGM
jgi:predicted RNase H-like nuclease (RuvC/YqgF family)